MGARKDVWQQYSVSLQVTVDTATRQHTATHCNTLQYTATHWNTPEYTATHCNTLQHSVWLHLTLHDGSNAGGLRVGAHQNNTLQHTATHYDTLQHTATHCNTLQHTTTH